MTNVTLTDDKLQSTNSIVETKRQRQRQHTLKTDQPAKTRARAPPKNLTKLLANIFRAL